MNLVRRIWGLGLVILLTGCHGSKALRSGCCPEYGYCKPSPMRYTSYCGCPTPLAQKYASRGSDIARISEVDSTETRK